MTDKKLTQIQWLSPRTLLIHGETCSPDIDGKAAEGDAEWDQNGNRSPADARKPQEVREVSLPMPSEASTTRVREGGSLPMSPWEKLDLEWRELTPFQEKEKFTNGSGLKKVLSNERQVKDAAADTPTFLLSERKARPWQRTFTLPLDVNMKAIMARLHGGLLSIDLPKRDMSDEPKVKIEIE